MAKHRRLSHDQKRKAKLAKEARKEREHVSLVYKGNKYKTPELADVYLHTERGILQAWNATGRAFTDRFVEAALESLVRQLRAGSPPPAEESEAADEVKGLIIAN